MRFRSFKIGAAREPDHYPLNPDAHRSLLRVARAERARGWNSAPEHRLGEPLKLLGLQFNFADRLSLGVNFG